MKPKLTAAIYDRWLYTLGGGEQVAFAYAEVLRDLGYETTLITHKEVDPKIAEQKMNVNLKDIHILYLPIRPSQELSEITEKYDVFINTSYLDYFPNRSKLGILSVFFPGKIFLSPFDYLKVAFIIPSLRRFFVYPTDFSGFRFDERQGRYIYKWLGKSSTIAFSGSTQSLTIELVFPTVAFSLLEELVFLADGKQILPHKRKFFHQGNIIRFRFDFPAEGIKKFQIVLPEAKFSYDVALTRLTLPGWRYLLYNGFKRLFPRWEMRLHGGPELTRRSDLQTYHRVVGISQFVQTWIQRYWHIKSQILYPPVSTHYFKPAAQKKNWIVHTGRFFVTGHNKKQYDMANVFMKMIDEKSIKDWEIHFIGSVHDGSEHQAYFQSVVEAAKGYPIFFHTNVGFSELSRLVGQAKIYWHATGLDENEENQPILMEHFGITTVEAMAAGCVPVVIAKGGQKEIIIPGSGFLWTTREELVQKTIELVQDSKLLKKMSTQAQRRSEFFDRKNFSLRLKKILETKNG